MKKYFFNTFIKIKNNKMEYSRNDTPNKKRKNTGEDLDNNLILQKLSGNIPTESGKQKLVKMHRYSLFVKNLAKSKKFKSLEKRRKKSSMDDQEKKKQKQKKPTYSEKFRRTSKPKVTFQSTSKNPKINEILKKLRESEERGNMTEKNNTNVGKIDSNKINKFLGFRDSRVNTEDIENTFNNSKVKNYVDQLNKKILMEKTSNENSNKKKVNRINKIKKNLKNKEFNIQNKEHSESSSDDEYQNIRNTNTNNNNINNFNTPKKDQEKYLNQKSNINYLKFAFNSYTIKDKNYKKNKKSNYILYLPKNQINFSILSQISLSLSLSKPIKKSALYPKRNRSIKIKAKSKKSSADLNESEENPKVKLYDIVGFDHKKRRMSILDILKKRKISIIPEEQISNNRNKISKSIKIVNKKNTNLELIKEIKEVKEKPEIVKYNDMVKYIVYTSIPTTKIKKEKYNMKELVMTKVADIALIVQKPLIYINEDDKKRNNFMIIEKKNDIEIVGNTKRSINNSIRKNKNSFHKKEVNSSLITKKINKQDPNLRISINPDNKEKAKNNTNINNNNLLINKQTLQNIKRENKSTGRRHLKSFLLFESNPSSNDEREKEPEKEKEKENEINELKQIKQITTNSKRLNQFDELFHSYATNYKTQKIPRKTSKSMAEEEILNKTSLPKRVNPIKKSMERQSIFTDTETNKSRALFKKKLLTSNKLLDDEIDLSKKKIYKVKTNKAKIKKFISKKNLKEKHNTSMEKRKNTNMNNKKYTDKNAKIKQFHGQRNINTDYINSRNIILQNTTVNHTTYNYYLNEQDKSINSKKNNSYKKKKY